MSFYIDDVYQELRLKSFVLCPQQNVLTKQLTIPPLGKNTVLARCDRSSAIVCFTGADIVLLTVSVVCVCVYIYIYIYKYLYNIPFIYVFEKNLCYTSITFRTRSTFSSLESNFLKYVMEYLSPLVISVL